MSLKVDVKETFGKWKGMGKKNEQKSIFYSINEDATGHAMPFLASNYKIGEREYIQYLPPISKQ